jgi:hypothetical protein
MIHALGISVAAVVASSVLAQASEPFNTEECRPQRWCPAEASAQGWKLKYESKSPENLADAYWRVEVWTRERHVMLCEHLGGRGGTRMNSCRSLREVEQ